MYVVTDTLSYLRHVTDVVFTSRVQIAEQEQSSFTELVSLLTMYCTTDLMKARYVRCQYEYTHCTVLPVGTCYI